MNSASQVSGLVGAWIASGMSKPDIIVKTAAVCMDWPYVWGAVGAECTPSRRQYYMGRSGIGEKDRENVKKSCPVLNGSQGDCPGCKWFPNNQRVLINDCQGFVKNVFSRIGINFKGGGCTSMWKDDSNWTEKGTIDRIPEKVCLVFIKAGETMSHVGIYIGGGQVIHCSHYVRQGPCPDRSWGWSHYAIPAGLYGDTPIKKPTLRQGDSGQYVVECQQDLIQLGYDLNPYGADGKYGAKTANAVRQFQSTHTYPPTGERLSADGICGQKTWSALDAAVGSSTAPAPAPVTKLYTVTVPHLTLEQANLLVTQYPGCEKKEEKG